MTNKLDKFLDKLPAKQSQRLDNVIEKIQNNKLQGLDITPLSGQKGWYRCRVGKIRIVFIRSSNDHNAIYQISFRGQAFKSL